MNDTGVRYGIVVLVLTNAHFAVVLIKATAESILEEYRLLFSHATEAVTAGKA